MPNFASLGAALMALAATAGPDGRAFHLSSPTFADGRVLPAAHVYDSNGCTGDNLSPALSWTTPPPGTKSLAVTLHDPDAPHRGGWWHWLLFDLPPDLRTLPAGVGNKSDVLPRAAVEAKNDFGTPGFAGACPPKGNPPHRYVLTLWALNVPSLGLNTATPGAAVETALKRHAIATTALTARYGR